MRYLLIIIVLSVLIAPHPVLAANDARGLATKHHP